MTGSTKAAIIAAVTLLGCSRPPAPAASGETTYLAGLTAIALGPNEAIESFAINTWGVDIRAVCRLPPGWRITAGRGAAPDGVISGEASHGVAWIRAGDLASLDNLVLVTLSGPLLPRPVGAVPPTFAGEARLAGGARERGAPLSASNLRLTRADRCPDPRR